MSNNTLTRNDIIKSICNNIGISKLDSSDIVDHIINMTIDGVYINIFAYESYEPYDT